MGKIVINGTGVSGLTSALMLSEKNRGNDVILIEKSAEPGGLLRKFDYGEFGVFDYGMHNFLETGIPAFDKLIFDLLPENEWQILEGPKRDLAGIYFNGKLQAKTPYIDLRSLSIEEYHNCIAAFMEHLDQETKPLDITNTSAYDYAVHRYGEYVAEHTLIPSLEKIHKKPARELDYMATIFTPMSRLAFCDETLVSKLTESEDLRRVIAWSDQRTLPLERSSGRKAYYPVNYGAYRVVDALVRKLKQQGVTILTETQITGVERDTSSGNIQTVRLSTTGNASSIEDVEMLIWTGNIPLLGRMLNMDFTGLKNDKPLKTVIVNILVDKPLDMGDLYYFFCYDPGFNTFRLTNFVNYSSGAARNGGYPICLELLMDEEHIKSGIDIERIATEELYNFGVTQPKTKVLFAKAEILESGFPMPSVNNIRGLKNIRNQIKSMSIGNLFLTGILAEDNLFFQTDVLIDVYHKLANYE